MTIENNLNNAEEVRKTKTEKQEQDKGDKTPEQEKTGNPPLPPVDFSMFILSLSSSALMHLGVIENPMTKQMEKNTAMAKHTIDIVEMFSEKTKGNLTEDEQRLVTDILHDLRMRYVKAVE